MTDECGPAPLAGFEAFENILAVCANPKVFASRLKELRSAHEAAAKAAAELAIERSKFQESVQSARAELAREKAELEARSLKIHRDAGELESRRATFEETAAETRQQAARWRKQFDRGIALDDQHDVARLHSSHLPSLASDAPSARSVLASTFGLSEGELAEGERAFARQVDGSGEYFAPAGGATITRSPIRVR